MFSLLCATFLQPTLHSDGIELPARLHRSESGLHYSQCGCSAISCLTCSHQSSSSKRCSAQAPAKDTKTQRGAEQHISSVCKENVWRLLPNLRKAAHPASGRAKVSPGRSPAASSQGSVSPKSLSALRLTGSPCLTETSKVIITKKKGGQQFLSCL